LRKQLKYAWGDILDHKLRYISLFFQTLAVCALVSVIFSILLDTNNFQNRLNGIMQSQEEEIYLLIDMSSTEKINDITNNKESLLWMRELFEFIKGSSSFTSYTSNHQNYGISLPNENLEEFSVIDPDNAFFLVIIDNEFQDVFKLKCAEGRIFSTDDFKDTGSEIPLLLGYDFQKYYDLDDMIVDNEGKCYRIVGFLEKSSFFLDPLKGEVIYWLDKAFVAPLQPDKFKDILDYDSAILSTFIITDDTGNLQLIQEKSNELGLYTFEFRSFTEQLKVIIDYANYKIEYLGFIMTIILIFAIISFISTLVQFITTHTKEFAIHLLCGGRIIDIINRILIQVFIVILLSDIVVIIIHKLSMVSLLTIASSLLIGLIIIIYPVVMLSKKQLNTILKRSQ